MSQAPLRNLLGTFARNAAMDARALAHPSSDVYRFAMLKFVRRNFLGLGTVALVLAAGCGSSTTAKPDAAPKDGAQDQAVDQAVDHAVDHASGDAADAGADVAVDAGDVGDAAAPTVVATLGAVPASLALAAGTLYVTVAESTTGHDGKLQSVTAAATDATADAGVTTLASGLSQPRAVAVTGGNVYWADTSTTFPNPYDVLSVPLAGGPATVVVPSGVTTTRLAIAGTILYTLTSNGEAISAVPLVGADGGAPGDAGSDAGTDAGTGAGVVYPGTPPNGISSLDSDGTSVFFFTNGTTNLDLFSVPVSGGTATDLAKNATSASVAFDFLVDDATTLYWSDSGSGSVFSLPKIGGTKTMLATFTSGSSPVQLVLDGPNVYALSATQLTRFPKTGGTPVVLASVSGAGADRYLASLGNAVALAVDDVNVYWLYEGHGQILKLSK
jgi:hypothetical protein